MSIVGYLCEREPGQQGGGAGPNPLPPSQSLQLVSQGPAMRAGRSLARWEGGVAHYNAVVPIKRIIPGQDITKEKLARARQLRREMTKAEVLLWNELHANKLGAHFRRQQIIAGFIVDFYCHAAALVVEVDGDIHTLADQQARDDRRDETMRAMGLKVVRFRNDEVEADLCRVVERIRELIQK